MAPEKGSFGGHHGGAYAIHGDRKYLIVGQGKHRMKEQDAISRKGKKERMMLDSSKIATMKRTDPILMCLYTFQHLPKLRRNERKRHLVCTVKQASVAFFRRRTGWLRTCMVHRSTILMSAVCPDIATWRRSGRDTILVGWRMLPNNRRADTTHDPSLWSQTQSVPSSDTICAWMTEDS